MQNGVGVLTYPSDDRRYIGEYLDNEKHGFGINF